MNLFDIIRHFVARHAVSAILYLALVNLLIFWFGNVILYHITWSIMIPIMIVGSLYLLVLFSIQSYFNEKGKEEKRVETN